MPRFATLDAAPAAPHPDAQDGGDAGPALLHRLLERLQRTPDFPALQASVTSLQRLLRHGATRLQHLAEVVRADPALTHRLLRLSNTAHYRAAGGSHASVERAIALLGLDALQQAALGARLLDRLPRDARGLVLREDYLRALLAARLAQLLCSDARALEAAYITALYQNLGRLVVAAHLADDALAVRADVPCATWPRVAAEQQASRRRLGLSYAQLGAYLARRWAWPETLRQAMRHEDWPLHASPLPGERLRWLGRLGNDLADLMLYQPPERWPQACARLVELAGAATGCSVDDLRRAVAAARADLAELAETVGLPVSQLQDWLQPDVLHQAGGQDADLCEATGTDTGHGAAAVTDADPCAAAAPAAGSPVIAGTAGTGGPAPLPVADEAAPVPLPRPAAATAAQAGAPAAGAVPPAVWAPLTVTSLLPQPPVVPPMLSPRPRPRGNQPAVAHSRAPRGAPVAKGYLSEQVQVLGEALLADNARHEVPRRALSVLCRALAARRAVLHLGVPGRDSFMPVRAVGQPPALPAAGRPWQVDPVAGRDLFARACARGSDVLVDDARIPQVARHLPEAFVQGLNARCFMVLPISARGRQLGMIYLDRDDDQPFVLDDQAPRLVRSVRNQAALALL